MRDQDRLEKKGETKRKRKRKREECVWNCNDVSVKVTEDQAIGMFVTVVHLLYRSSKTNCQLTQGAVPLDPTGRRNSTISPLDTLPTCRWCCNTFLNAEQTPFYLNEIDDILDYRWKHHDRYIQRSFLLRTYVTFAVERTRIDPWFFNSLENNL